MVWNVLTAQGWGLDVWGKIVGLESGRTLHIPGGAEYLGFNEAASSWTGFNLGGFYNMYCAELKTVFYVFDLISLAQKIPQSLSD
jgi:hypothetical protein